MAHIIVVGNEKGGSGKSTTSMHVATALARMGKSVGLIDLDLRQRTLGQYVENRRSFAGKKDLSLPTPDYRPLPEVDKATLNPGENMQDRRLSVPLSKLEIATDSRRSCMFSPGFSVALSTSGNGR